jgi:hypothetical protein
MKFGAKRDPLQAQLGFFRAKFHSKYLYSVEKEIVGISQYAYFKTDLIIYFSALERRLTRLKSFCQLFVLYLKSCNARHFQLLP